MPKFSETNLPTVRELADLLDLHDEERLEEAIEAVHDACSLSDDPSTSRRGLVLLAEFEATYFKEYMGAVIQMDDLFARWQGLSLIAHGNGKVHLVRLGLADRPLATRIFEAVLHCSQLLVPLGLRTESSGHVQLSPKAQRDIMIQLLIFFQIYLAALDPPASSLPYHTARTRHLVEACRSLVDLSRQPGFPAELDGPPVLGAVIAERLLTPGGSERAKAAVREVAETWDPLRVCHARRLSPPCNTTGSLQACSRCKSVTYCGPEHQRLHWTEHKPVCFPPAW